MNLTLIQDRFAKVSFNALFILHLCGQVLIVTSYLPVAVPSLLVTIIMISLDVWLLRIIAGCNDPSPSLTLYICALFKSEQLHVVKLQYG